MLILPC